MEKAVQTSGKYQKINKQSSATRTISDTFQILDYRWAKILLFEFWSSKFAGAASEAEPNGLGNFIVPFLYFKYCTTQCTFTHASAFTPFIHLQLFSPFA